MKRDDADVQGVFEKITVAMVVLAFLWWFAIISLVLAAAFFIVERASAAELPDNAKNTLKGRENVCKSLGQTAFDIIDLRDSGVSFPVFQEWIRARLVEAKGDSNSFIATDADIEFVVEEYRKVYTDTKMDGNKASLKVYDDCMGAAKKSSFVRI